MSRENAGVQAILRQNYIPGEIYIHCYAHQLNLVICDVSKVVAYLPGFYSVLSTINSYVSRMEYLLFVLKIIIFFTLNLIDHLQHI